MASSSPHIAVPSPGFEIRRLGECTIPSPCNDLVFVEDNEGVCLHPIVNSAECPPTHVVNAEKSGPRRKIFFDPATTKAALVTCGGLSPGLNEVIRAVVICLWHKYGVRNIVGLKYGYEGLCPSKSQTIELTPEVVKNIHAYGGTILGTSRDRQDVKTMVDFLVDNKINILFTIGGNGTQAGALAISKEAAARNLSIAVVGIPKTIDNDLLYTDRTFGFETAVDISQTAISGAHTEARSHRGGIGLVKLMGRESGFIALHASLASGDVNLTLIPEVPFTYARVNQYLEERLKREPVGHAVVVVAEGAGQDLISKAPPAYDAGGRVILRDIAIELKAEIEKHFKSKNIPMTLKYIDPSYIIRSAPANPSDKIFCLSLAQAAVHAAMTGRTAMVVGSVGGHLVHLPIEKTIESTKKVDPKGELYQALLQNTGMPASLV